MSNMANLLAAVQKAKGSSATPREEFYYPERDAAKNGQAIIRFLPSSKEEDAPFVKTFSHGFKNDDNGKWFFDECNTTIGGDCPVCASNQELWNTGLKSNQDIVRKRKRKVSYISNILVVKDFKTPENDGKVFKFKYGQKIFDMIVGKLSPEFEGEDVVNVFDLKEGANFRFKIRQLDGQTNYDKSEWESVSAIEIPEGEKDKLVDIQDYLNPTRFKTVEEVQKNLDRVLGNTVRMATTAVNKVEDFDDDIPFETEAKTVSKKEAVKPPVNDEEDEMARLLRELDS